MADQPKTDQPNKTVPGNIEQPPFEPGKLKEGQVRVKVNGIRQTIDLKDFNPEIHTPLTAEDHEIVNKEMGRRKNAA